MTLIGKGDQDKLVKGQTDALKEVARLAEYASELEGRLGLIPKIERK